MIAQFAIGAALAAIVALAAWRARALDGSGAIGAWFVGTAVFGAGGWQGAAVLLAFFVPSTILSRIGRERKRALDDVGKQGPRDLWQVLANGGIAALCALAAVRFASAPLAAAFAGAFAAASADTWGTEIGTLVRQRPRSIVTFREIATGLSGGVTVAGTLAEFGGAFAVAIVAAATGVAAFLPVAIGGVAGAIVDSLIGATFQALRWCPQCAAECETNPHHCGAPTIVRRGASWIENDAVNFAATLTGALAAGLMTTVANR
jgi:uncharacterized protein (TIGR00297 family)